MAKIDAAYSYYLMTYADKRQITGSKNGTHKKSELREVYNSILKDAKDTPLYKINMDGDVKRFAIDVKEHARDIQDVIDSISGENDDVASLLDQKVAVSSDEDAVGVTYIGDNSSDALSGFEMDVRSLAQPQVNTGNYLNPNGHDFEVGSFSFDLDTPSNSYEFQLNVTQGDSNRDIQDKVARLVNNSDVGLLAQVLTDDAGNTALQLTSKQTGLSDEEDYLFHIQSGASFNELNTLGINQVSSPASNSDFSLNGVAHSSLSNSFTINKNFEIHLNGTTEEGSPVTIGFKANTDAVADSVEQLLNAYNGMLTVGQTYTSGHNNSQLYNEISSVARTMATDLEDIGITPDNEGFLSLDKEALGNAVNGDKSSAFGTLNRFKNSLNRKASSAAINPMKFVDKLTVEYKNPGKTFTAVYATSAYAGLIVDQAL